MKKTFRILSQTALITLLSALWILVLPQLITSVYAVTVSDEAGLRAAFRDATGTSDNPTEIVLGSDITLNESGDLDVNNKYVVLNLNGKNLNLGSGSNNIDVYNSGNLSISGGGEITGSNDSDAISIGNNGKCYLNSGTVTSTGITATGVVRVANGAEFHMSGGSVVGTAIAVYVIDGASFVMSGGTIEANANSETVFTKGTTTITGGTIKNTGNGDAIRVWDGETTITGGTIKNTGNGDALHVSGGTATQNGGTIIGRIDVNAGNGTFNYQSGVNDDHPATPSGSGKDDNDEHDDDHEDAPAPAPAPKPLNPNAILVSSFTGIGGLGGNVKIGPQVQGPAAQLAFRNGTPAGWKEAFTFNMTVKDKADYTLKKGTLSFRIPTQYLNAGRKFAILGLDKNGKVKVFNDTDLKADTITVNLDIEGYAFDLIYSD